MFFNITNKFESTPFIFLEIYFLFLFRVFLQISISFLDIVNAGEIPLRNSDKVKVSLPLAEFERLQEHDLYGSWNSGMEQVNPRKT